MRDEVSHQRLHKAMTGQAPHFRRAQGQDCLPQGCFYFLFTEKMCVIYYKVFLLPTLSVVGIMTSETHCPKEHSPHTELSSLKAISCAGVSLLKEYYF